MSGIEDKSRGASQTQGPKSTRAGCLLCKPHKRQGARLLTRQRHSQTKRIVAVDAEARLSSPS